MMMMGMAYFGLRKEFCWAHFFMGSPKHFVKMMILKKRMELVKSFHNQA